jgi:hypothetical protein
MIEHVTTAVEGSDWYETACRRARASVRRPVERSREWPEFAPPIGLSEGPLGQVQAADREIARQTSLRARAVAQFAASRPATNDRAQGEPGAMSAERWAARPAILRGVSEWAARELVVALSISNEAAEALIARSLTLVHRLPGTLAALEAGALNAGHLWPMLEKVAPIEDDVVRAEVEADLLRWAAGRVTTPAQLGARARREVARWDARAAARQLARAIRERGVQLRPEPVDGMAAVTTLLTTPEALALYRALEAYADAVPDDPDAPRTRGQKMADCLLDLVLRPGETQTPPVQVLLTVVASVDTMAGGDRPGEIDGSVVPAEVVREVLRGLTQRHVDADFPAPAEVCWQQAEQEELGRWWAEVERRVLTGVLGSGPDPMLDGDVLCKPDAALDTDAALDLDAALDTEVRDGSDAGSFRASDTSVDPSRDADRLPNEPDGWWAAADSAVDEAGQAVRRAQQALSDAQRVVDAAAEADSADEAAWRAGPGRFTEAGDALAVLRSMTDVQRDELVDLLTRTAGGGLVERPRIALTDALSGALLAMTDLPGLRRAGTCGAPACRRTPQRCNHDMADRAGLGPPPPTDGYRPSAQLDRWVRARDRRCRFPGCRRRVPRRGELDHHRPYPLGPTSAANLAGYCTGDHRGKHQAPGWRHALSADGTLTVTTPTGLTAVTTPAAY